MAEQKHLDADQLAVLLINGSSTLLEAMAAVDRGGQEIAFVCDDEQRVIGTLTDGDIRRILLSGAALSDRVVDQAMNTHFVAVDALAGRAEVLDLMRARGISQIPVLDKQGRLCGLHLLRQMMGGTERPNCAVIMAGGKGTRLRPLTEHIPKPMVPVAGRPILERLVLHLVGHGIRSIYISVNYLSHVIEEHFGDGSEFGCSIEYLRENVPLGTAGALSLLESVPTDPVVVVNGDLVTQFDLGRMLEFHKRGDFAATVGLRPHTLEIPYGVATVDGDSLVSLREKPSQRMLVNAGVYVLSDSAIGLVPRGQDYPMTTLLEDCATNALAVGAHVIEDDWADIGRPEDLQRARGAS